MLKLKDEKIKEESDKIKASKEKIDPKKMIKDAITTSLSKGNIVKLQDDKEELITSIYNRTIKNYMDYVKKCSIKESKERLEKAIEEYNKDIKSVLIKSENELKEYKNKYLFIFEQNKNLQEKLYSLQNYNKQLLSQIHLYHLNLEKFEKHYQTLSKQKELFEEIIRAYPDKDPSFIIKEFENMKEGNIQILKDYQNISLKLQETNERQKKIEKENRLYADKLNFENKLLIQDKNSIEEKYIYKINTLEHQLTDIEEKVKENQFLKNTIFHIYNLLFEELALNRNLNIDNKYLDVKESDFSPNFFYDNEIKNYIHIMIKTMHQSTYDIIYRETMGYLNMILRIYLPSKLNLRFQPAKAFKEIKDFIDLKMEKIEENQRKIDEMKQELEKRDIKIFKMQQEMKALNKEYNSYKKIVDKEFDKTNKIIFQLKNNKEKNINNTSNTNIITKNLSFNKERIDKFKVKYTKTEKNFRKAKSNYYKDMSYKIKKKKSFSFKPNKKIMAYDYINEKNKKEKITINNNNLNTLSTNKASKTVENMLNKDIIFEEFLKIKKSNNEDKIIKENGNQQLVNNFNNMRLLVNETNRLFMYRPKMNIAQDKIYKMDKSNKLKNKVFITYNDLKKDEEENMKKKIFKQINGLIASSTKNKFSEE